MRTAIPSLSFLSLLLIAVPTEAQAAWRTLGNASVSRSGWRTATIPVRSRTSVSALRLCAEQNRIRFESARVRFSNNRHVLVEARANVARGRCTPALWVPGGRRPVVSVQVTTSQPNARTARARIRLEGR